MFELETLWDSFKRDGIVKQFTYIFSAASVSQFLPLLISPVLSRLYPPSAYGYLSEFSAVLGVFSAVATIQFNSALMLPRRNEEALLVLGVGLKAVCITSFISLIFVALSQHFHFGLINFDSIGTLWYLLPAVVLIIGSSELLTGWHLRLQNYKVLAVNKIETSVPTIALKLIFGLLGSFSFGLLYGMTSGRLSGFILLLYRSRSAQVKTKKLASSLKVGRRILSKYVDYLRYTTWQGFFDVLSVAFVVGMITRFTSLENLGYYSFALAITHKPVQVFSAEMSKIYFQKLVGFRHSKNSPVRFSFKLLIALTVIGLFTFLPLFWLGEELFSFVFGDDWSRAGQLSQALIPLLVVSFVFSPFTRIPEVFSRQRDFFIIAAILSIIPPLVFYFCFTRLSYGFVEIVTIVSSTTAIARLFVVSWFFRVLKSVKAQN